MIFYRAMPIEADSIRKGDYLTKSPRFAINHAITTSIHRGEDYGVFFIILGEGEVEEAHNPGEWIYTGDGKQAKLKGIAKYNEDWADSEYHKVTRQKNFRAEEQKQTQQTKLSKESQKRLITTARLLHINCLHSEAMAIESLLKTAMSDPNDEPESGGLVEITDPIEEVSFNPFSHLEDIGGDSEEIDPKDCVLTFGTSNSKLSYLGSTSFSLPAGYSCPYAAVCKSKIPREGGKIEDYGDIRCFQTSLEAAYPSVRDSRWKNFDLVRGKSADDVASVILRSLRHHEKEVRGITTLRIHDSGDFFSQAYFDGWLKAAKERPDIVFYAYTKSIPYWKARKEDIPPNLRLIASQGGKADDEIEDEFRKAIIVSGVDEAIEKELNIDVNEFLALFGEGDFALLIHGNQPKNQMIGGRKATSVARENGKMIKELAKKNRLPANTLRRLLDKITDAAQAERDKSNL